MWFTSPRALQAAHVSLLTTSAASAPAPRADACYIRYGDVPSKGVLLVCSSAFAARERRDHMLSACVK